MWPSDVTINIWQSKVVFQAAPKGEAPVSRGHLFYTEEQ